MKGARKVIVTGDDFGESHDVNHAIIRAHESGILTGASLMVTGDAFEEAVALAKRHPTLAVGLHLVVAQGKAVLPPNQIPRIVDLKGRFSPSATWAGLRYQWDPVARRQLRLEIRAQLDKFRQTKFPLSHVDGHLHLHMHPVVLGILIDLAGEFSIKAIRLPGEELGTALDLDRTGFIPKAVTAWVFGRLRRFGERRLKTAGIRYPKKVYGLLQTGRMDEMYLLGLIPKIKGDSIEIYSHPTLAQENASPRGASRAQLEALLSQKVREALAACGFELSSYQELN